ncbi:MAG: hypothetical protein WCY41_01030 [Candidatus Micrarchaeia archaeon]
MRNCSYYRGQGATEYLVLLAVVLIVALVSVALLGFFPGMASDAQITQSQIYWRSATPIAIVETAARIHVNDGTIRPYLLLRNTGMYPIRITGIIGGDGGKATKFYAFADELCNPAAEGTYNISDYYYLAPGEEKYIAPGGSRWYGLPCHRWIVSYVGGTSSGDAVRGASSVCQNSTTSPGVLDYKTFGFEYIQYMEGQQITKRQIGKDLIIKCREPA